jgi:hypothetical protein
MADRIVLQVTALTVPARAQTARLVREGQGKNSRRDRSRLGAQREPGLSTLLRARQKRTTAVTCPGLPISSHAAASVPKGVHCAAPSERRSSFEVGPRWAFWKLLPLERFNLRYGLTWNFG